MSNNKWPSTRQSLLGDSEKTQEVWAELVSIYAPLLFRYAKGKGLSAEDSEDVVQEVLFKITRFSYEPAKGKFRSWLATVAGRQIRDQWKKIANRKQVHDSVSVRSKSADGAGMGDWEEVYFGRLLQLACQNIREEFAPEQWRVFEALQFHPKKTDSPEELARQLNKPVAWVYKLNHKINLRLKAEVNRLGEDWPRPPESER